MVPLLTQLSPIAAKLYLALHLYPDPTANPPIAQVSREHLAADTNMSIRSCSDALRDLAALKLITRLPRRAHQPARFQIHSFPAQPAAHIPGDAHPIATNIPTNKQPAANNPHTQVQPAANNSLASPIPISKTHNAHPAATYSTLSLTPDEEALLDNPALLKLLMDSLTTEENAQLPTAAHATLTRLNKESHP